MVPSIENWEQFALTFDGYAALGSERCAEIANKQSPSTLTELRACLFFEQRRCRHFSRNPDAETSRYLSAPNDLGSLGIWRCTIRRAITNAAAFKKRNDHRKLTRNFSTSSAIIWRSRRILRNPVDVRPAMQERSECSAQRLDIMFGRCCSKAHHDRRNGCSQAGLARRRRSYELHLNFFESWIGRRCNWEVIGDCGDQIEARLRGLQ